MPTSAAVSADLLAPADGCSQVNATTWKVCNNRCGYVTPTQAAAYNAGAISHRRLSHYVDQYCHLMTFKTAHG
jgi:hypothetical protein